MLGATGGLLLLGGIITLFNELPSDQERITGLALALLTLVVGSLLSFVDRDGAARAAGVTLAAGAVAPLTALVIDRPEQFDRTDVLVTGLLACLLWIALFVGGPARGHGLFLGLALAGLWLTAESQTEPAAVLSFFDARPAARVETAPEVVELRPLDPEIIEPPAITVPDFPRTPLSRPRFTVPTSPPPELIFPEPNTVPFPTPTFQFPSPSTTTSTSTTTTTTAEQSLGRPDLVASTQDDEPPRPPIAPAVVALVFGAVYLAVGVVLDAVRLRRIASVFVVVSVFAVLSADISFGFRYGVGASGLLGLFTGAAFVAVGLAGSRRFLAWFGAFVTAAGIGIVVADRIDDSPATAAVVLLLVGGAVVAGGFMARTQER